MLRLILGVMIVVAISGVSSAQKYKIDLGGGSFQIYDSNAGTYSHYNPDTYNAQASTYAPGYNGSQDIDWNGNYYRGPQYEAEQRRLGGQAPRPQFGGYVPAYPAYGMNRLQYSMYASKMRRAQADAEAAIRRAESNAAGERYRAWLREWDHYHAGRGPRPAPLIR